MLQSVDPITALLLRLEWLNMKCPECGQPRTSEVHRPMCTMDEGISMRGLSTQADRNAARARIQYASAPTLPPSPDTKEE